VSGNEVDFGAVKIFLCDVDGVLTNAGVFLDGKTEFKQFNIQDGMGLRMLQKFGVPVGWVSNRHSDATTARAEELQVDYLWQESKPKVAAVAGILEQAGFSWEEACFMSDDINDLAVLARVGLPIAVANAREDVKAVAKYTTQSEGGEGAVREVCDAIIRAKGEWNTVIERLRNPEGYREQ